MHICSIGIRQGEIIFSLTNNFFFRLDSDKHLVASLLSGTFDRKKSKKSPLSTLSSLTLPDIRSESPPPPQRVINRHYKQPSEPIMSWTHVGSNPRVLLPDMPPLFKNKYHSNIISPPINEPFSRKPNPGASGAQITPPTLEAQFKARSWPRNPGTNSFGILPDGKNSFTTNSKMHSDALQDPEMVKYAAKINHHQTTNYPPAPAPGVIPDTQRYIDSLNIETFATISSYYWNDENEKLNVNEKLNLKDSLKASTLGEPLKDFYSNGGTSDFDEPQFEQVCIIKLFFDITAVL